MDYDRLVRFLLDPARTTPVFRRSLRLLPNDALRNSGLNPGEIANMVSAVAKVNIVMAAPPGLENLSEPCFAGGTSIATMHGQKRVEELAVGDTVRTMLSGKPQPIVWIGHRTVDCTRHPMPQLVWPVRVAAGAFGRSLPARDLLLSPDHAVYADGVLIPVKYLVNSETIAQVPCDSVTYYHLELPRHDVVLAEGLPAESYRDTGTGDRANFANGGPPIALYPDFSPRVWQAEGCAEQIVTGPKLDAVRELLARTARRKRAARKRAA